jgi:TonB family protein
MSVLHVAVQLAMLLAAGAGAQQRGASGGAEPVQVQVFAPGPDVTAPELLPFDAPLNPPESCEQEVDGKVKLSLLVDAAGRPRNIMFLRPLANDLDRFALQIAEADRFTPGTHSGSPVAVEVSLEVEIKSCVEETKDNAGNKSLILRMRSLPEQRLGPPAEPYSKTIVISQGTGKQDIASGTARPERIGGKVWPPDVLKSVEAPYTLEARKARINGYCLVSVIVDAHGMPQNPRVAKSLDPGLDQNALFAVKHYRFKPALKNGSPVPVMITVEVNFRLY